MQTGLQDRLQEISGERFAAYGILSLAYVKRAVIKGHPVYAMHAANGEYLWHYADEEVARAALLQQDMQPARVH
jgi:hypothetical protein